VFEDQRRQLVDVHFRFVVVSACFLSPLSRSLPTARTALAADDVADARLAVALAHVLAFLVVETKLVFVERFDRDFDGALAVGKDNGFVGNDRSEVFANRFFHAILMTLLIDDALAL